MLKIVVDFGNKINELVYHKQYNIGKATPQGGKW